MSYLHFCGGDRGGVGKTLFCKTLVSYYKSIEKAVTVFDTDRANQDLYKLKGEEEREDIRLRRSVFSENPEYEDEPDEILYEALGGNDVIVNLPAGATASLRLWWERCGAAELCEEQGIEVTHWFLTGGDNVHLLINSVRQFSVPHIIVKNEHLRSDWGIFEDKIDHLKLEQISLLRLGRYLADILNNDGMFLDDCLDGKTLRILERQKLKYFIGEMGKRVSETGRVPLASVL